MKKVKRLITLLLSLALLMTAVPVQAEENENGQRLQTVQIGEETATESADETTESLIYPTGDLPEPQIYEAEEDLPAANSLRSGARYSTEAELYTILEDDVKEALLAGETRVDVSGYGIDMDEYKVYALLYFSPYLGMNMDVRAYYYSETGQYAYLALDNDMTIEETEEYFSQVDQKVNEILSIVSDDMTDVEKALAVHDYFVYYGKYDYENYINNTIPRESYSSAGLFMKGTGVCNAYAYGYQYIMTKLGFECYVTSSDEMNHAWNIIKIDGKYYHVDCTWDDPTPDSWGRVYHRHFLISDYEIENVRDHHGWDRTDLVCSDTSYDDEYWIRMGVRIIQIKGKTFYLTDDKVYYLNDGTGQELAELGYWREWGRPNYAWNASFSGFFYKNGYIYYNTAYEIMRISVDTLQVESVYEADVSEGYVYDVYPNGEEIRYLIKTAPSDEGVVHTSPVSAAIPAERITLNQTSAVLTQGDTLQLTATVEPANASTALVWSSSDPEIASVDDKGLVTTKNAGNVVITVQAGDVLASCSITVEKPPYVLGDVNSDGTIDISDLRLVLRYVCGKVEFSQQQLLAGDVVTDGKVNIEDLRLILRYICGKAASF